MCLHLFSLHAYGLFSSLSSSFLLRIIHRTFLQPKGGSFGPLDRLSRTKRRASISSRRPTKPSTNQNQSKASADTNGAAIKCNATFFHEREPAGFTTPSSPCQTPHTLSSSRLSALEVEQTFRIEEFPIQ